MSKLKPLISIIVPVFNNEDTIRRCVDSVRQQSYKNTEIILVDDGSTDNCGAICDEYTKIDERVRVIHKENGGQSSARNCGLNIANGSLIGFVDSDDFIAIDMYEKLYDLLFENEAQIACAGIQTIDEGGNPLFTFAPDSGEIILYNREDALGEHLVGKRITTSLCDKLFLANIFAEVRMIEGMIYEDLEVVPRCLNNAECIVYTSEPMYNYVMTSQSTMRGKFNVHRFDLREASHLRAQFYDLVCPKYSIRAWNAYLDDCFILVHQAYGVEDYKPEIVNIKMSIIDVAERIGIDKLQIKTKLRYYLLRMGTPFFSFTSRIWYRIRYAMVIKLHYKRK